MYPRIFTPKQRDRLWQLAGGRCRICNELLGPGWHADHIHPHSDGGPTTVANGQALCAACNLRKGAQVKTVQNEDPRTIWQDNWLAIDWQDHLETGNKDYTLAVPPGCGKTRAAWMAVRRSNEVSGVSAFVVVCVPTSALVDQWLAAAQAFGLDYLGDPRGDAQQWTHSENQGIITTYSGLLGRAAQHAFQHPRMRNLFVILDEVHHLGGHEDDARAWARRARDLFNNASQRLALTGTPFRTDGQPIPFLKYDDEGYVKADYELSIGDALKHEMIRPVTGTFVDISGNIVRTTWDDTGRPTHKPRFLDTRTKLNKTQGNELIRAYTNNKDTRTLDQMTMLAHDMLLESRLPQHGGDQAPVWPDAGGLAVCANISSAERVAASLNRAMQRSPHGPAADVVIVTEKEKDPHRQIQSFRHSRTCWIVAVGMVSEGIDISRLTTLLWLTNKSTPMAFIQLVGRVMRLHHGIEEDAALRLRRSNVIMPNLEHLVEMMRTLHQMERQALEDDDADPRDVRVDDGLFDPNPSSTEVIDTQFNGIDHVIAVHDGGGSVYAGLRPYWQTATQLAEEVGLKDTTKTAIIAAWLSRQKPPEIKPVHVVGPDTPTPRPNRNAQHRRKLLRDIRGDLVKRIVRQENPDGPWDSALYAQVTAELNQAAGIDSIGNATEEELERAVEVAWARFLGTP